METALSNLNDLPQTVRHNQSDCVKLEDGCVSGCWSLVFVIGDNCHIRQMTIICPLTLKSLATANRNE